MDPANKGRGNGYALSRDLTARLVPIASCKPLGRETRNHPRRQLRKLARSIDRFGFVLPILIDCTGCVVGGWGLILAAKELGLTEIPAVTITDLSSAELRALRLALNRITEEAAWNREQLALEFSEILEIDPSIELQTSGFDIAEIDVVLSAGGRDQEEALAQIDPAAPPATCFGDLWILGKHSLLCGDALQSESYPGLLGSERAHVVFADLQNAPELRTASPDGFALASHKLPAAQRESFLTVTLGHAACWSRDAAIHLVCADWEHLPELLAVGRQIYGAFENLCVWTQAHPRKAASASLYTFQHELICLFRVGKALSNNGGRRRRRRPDVWDYGRPDICQGSSKPVALIADALRDCSKPGDVMLDPFGGYGASLIAAERTGRRARVIERNPSLVDLSIDRWERLSGRRAHHAESGRPFERTPTAAAPAEDTPHDR